MDYRGLFTEPANGLKGNYYPPFVAGLVSDLEQLADKYYFYFSEESHRKFKYYSKLTAKQRAKYRQEHEWRY